MFRFKNFTSALSVSFFLLFSTYCSAFDLPKEFSEIGKHHFYQTELLDVNPSPVYEGNTGKSKNIKAALLSQYSRWKGTQYHWGGTTHRGVDCSALMQHIFNDSLHTELPRTTFEQIKNGTKVNKNNLKPGDLVFFKTTPGDRHVGVYIGDDQFIHASKIQGVTISSLTNQYWVDHYETARRLELTA